MREAPELQVARAPGNRFAYSLHEIILKVGEQEECFNYPAKVMNPVLEALLSEPFV